jgi:hypothetical protein
MAQVSQMFGEMVGAWVAHTWAADLGAPARLALVRWGVQRACIFEAGAGASASSRPEKISREHFRLQFLCIPSLWLCVLGLHAHQTSPTGNKTKKLVCMGTGKVPQSLLSNKRRFASHAARLLAWLCIAFPMSRNCNENFTVRLALARCGDSNGTLLSIIL